MDLLAPNGGVIAALIIALLISLGCLVSAWTGNWPDDLK